MKIQLYKDTHNNFNYLVSHTQTTFKTKLDFLHYFNRFSQWIKFEMNQIDATIEPIDDRLIENNDYILMDAIINIIYDVKAGLDHNDLAYKKAYFISAEKCLYQMRKHYAMFLHASNFPRRFFKDFDSHFNSIITA